MANNKHLTLTERFCISNSLDHNLSFKAIGIELNKDCTTISKEIRNLCSPCASPRKFNFCKFCKSCNSMCTDFKQEFCSKHLKAPYVCNGCEKLKSCTLEKHFYHAVSADTEYREILSESRSGFTFTEAEIIHLDSVISPLIMKGQSLNHICINNKDTIMASERTIYRLVNYNLFSARNIDLPRKVRYKSRKIKKHYKIDKVCRIGRTYQDYTNFTKDNPDLPITQIDSVEGKKGGKVLLTIHFVKAELMLAFIRDSNDSQSVINIFNKLYLEMRPDIFISVIPVILGDNGSEFSNPTALEFDSQDNRRTQMFYCDTSAPQQKGSAERNHELICYFIPQGNSLDSYTQRDITLMMNHINSYCRESLGNKCPYVMFSFLYGESVLVSLGCSKIPANDVTLNKSIWNKEDNHE